MRKTIIALGFGAMTIAGISARPTGDVNATCSESACSSELSATSTLQTVRQIMERNTPALQFNPEFTPEQFKEWQTKVTATMGRLMRHPDAEFAAPKLIKKVKRDGYSVERWLSYPIEGSIVPFLVLIPDGADAKHKVPGVLCIPGWGQSKEQLAGERNGNYSLDGDADPTLRPSNMALHMVRNGYIAVAVDNPSFGELSYGAGNDYLLTSRYLLEGGWSYPGLTSWQHRVALNHLRNRTDVNPERLVVSGFSLGTEPLMVLGALERDIYAFVYADIFCRTRERILKADKPDENGVHHFPNTDEHLIPEFLNNFDFPDLVANLAPRHLICTEGGMDRDFGYVKQAFGVAGHPNNFTYMTYNADQHPAEPVMTVPSGLSLSEYYSYLFTAPHHFKPDVVMPWLKNVLE